MKTKKSEKGRQLMKWLLDARHASGMNMREVAAKLKVPHSWVGKVELGDRRLDVLEYVRYCQVLGADAKKGLDVVAGVKKAAKAGRK
jgi:transcriptional regulator with XRE-family HTH domain